VHEPIRHVTAQSTRSALLSTQALPTTSATTSLSLQSSDKRQRVLVLRLARASLRCLVLVLLSLACCALTVLSTRRPSATCSTRLTCSYPLSLTLRSARRGRIRRSTSTATGWSSRTRWRLIVSLISLPQATTSRQLRCLLSC
jgi:hypothetical protein